MLDLVLIAACYYFAYRLRFEGESLDHFLPYFTASLPVVLGCKLASLYGSGLYQRSWETFSLRDIGRRCLRGVLMGSVLSVLAAAYFYRLEGFSRVVFMHRRAAADGRDRRHARIVPQHEPGCGVAQQAEPPRARLRRRARSAS